MSAQDAPESHRTKDADSLRVLFCIGVTAGLLRRRRGRPQKARLAGDRRGASRTSAGASASTVHRHDGRRRAHGRPVVRPGPGPPTSSPTRPTSRPSPASATSCADPDRRGPAVALPADRGAGRAPAVLPGTPDGRAGHGCRAGARGARSPTRCTPPGTRSPSPTWTATRQPASPASWTRRGRPRRPGRSTSASVRRSRTRCRRRRSASGRRSPCSSTTRRMTISPARSGRSRRTSGTTVLAVNLRGVLFGCQIAGAADARAAASGRIVNISSTTAHVGGIPAPALRGVEGRRHRVHPGARRARGRRRA